MATSHADIPAVAPQKQPRRSVNRIIPAVPHRFSRPPAVRPLTPEEFTTVTQRDPDKQPAIKSAKPEAAPAAVETPLTPDSRVSPVENRDEEEHALASSPARSGDDQVEDSTETQGAATEEQSFPAQTGEELAPTPQPEQPVDAAANGERPKSTVRTALPPEFYPREKPMGHMEVAAHLPSAHISAHRPQVSVEGLVFGGIAQESPAMPSTPQDFEQGVRAAQQGFSRPPPGLAPPHLAPQFYPGHSHHPSESAASWPHPPFSMAMPPDAVYANGNEFHSPAYPPASGAFQAPFAAPFSPQVGPVSMNGVAMRSHSQSPSKSQHGEPGPGSNYCEEPQNVLYANELSLAKQTTSEGYDTSKHIFNQFGNPEFTDYVLHIRSPEAMLWSMPVHAVMVSRSPVIFEALRHSTPPPFQTKDTRRSAEVLIDDRFVTPESLNEAIKVLYAAPLLPAEAFLYNLSPYNVGHDQDYASNEARKRMGQAISYAAAGRVLQIPEMQACGLRIAKSLLRWDTLDMVLHFGCSANKTTVQPNGFGADNRILETYAVPLLDDALEFIAYNFPSDFALYSIAPELRQSPRLPAVVESKQPSHNPRLSKIRFGDAPPEDELKPSPVTQLLSSILLSLPLALLDPLFSHPAAANQVGWSGLVRIMREVIEEREKRRQKVLKSLVKSLDSSISRALLENVYREEHVEPTSERASGFKPVAVRPSEQT
ncbi:uncharacterized protein N0V89_008502 [Didymosphaeria variabile]|uniref:BTB domain-containing protein n=1 Tax=Didymosphaeria variabile TaxID=1932322 RepID=A0A9W9C8W2_9PLEO|nr:uncharacterized protein N0V89_008502 [Didymosphaeria variabile]KAJ4349883.1 hypothetical protein N0V89_008502 [Didymosphaeria variabile]